MTAPLPGHPIGSFPTGVRLNNDESGKTTQLAEKAASVDGFTPLHWTNYDYIFNFPYSSHPLYKTDPNSMTIGCPGCRVAIRFQNRREAIASGNGG